METANTTNIATLKFKRTWTPKQFMAENNLEKIDVVINPKTNKRFFTTSDSEIGGKADKTGDYKQNPVISLCEDSSTGEEFFLLHKQASENVEHSFAL